MFLEDLQILPNVRRLLLLEINLPPTRVSCDPDDPLYFTHKAVYKIFIINYKTFLHRT